MSNNDITPTLDIYSELQKAFDHYNARLFAGQIPHCLITMQREKRTYGYFSSNRFVHRADKTTTDEIALNPSYFGVVPLLEILQTLVHEMAHAWQFHFGDPGRRTYHNKEWADKMESIGLMPSSTGKPGGARTGEKMADYPIEGGLFMQATDELLEQGFKVSWLDRFPPISPLAASPLAASDFIADNTQDDPSRPVDELSTVASLFIQPMQGNRSNRTKYRCPECLAQIWGKPNLKVLCGGDGCGGVAFEVAD